MASNRPPGRNATRRSSTRQRRRARRWLWTLGLILIGAASVGYLTWNYGWAGVPGVGDQAPAFVLEDSAGQPANLGDYLGRKPVLLAFYMTYG